MVHKIFAKFFKMVHKHKLEGELCYFALRGNLDKVQSLIANGADVNIDNNYPLRTSANIGHLEIVKLLVEQGVKSRY